ncbi:MAG TPA: adenylyl-sulfate kinase [Pseudonocardiaceae bacterium]|nr:adenylyl-sulfate kinase [Pseudonocardiaceae bacterium]
MVAGSNGSTRHDTPSTVSGARHRHGGTLWLTGLPSAGKTTIALAVAELLRELGRSVEVLDGDEIRRVLGADLGYSRAERDANVARIGYLAHLLARNGVLVIAAVVSPFTEARRAVRTRHAAAGTPFLEIHVATPLAVCASRDVKGLYARQQSGQLTGLTGVDDAYELPESPELRLDTAGRTVHACVSDLCALLRTRGLV